MSVVLGSFSLSDLCGCPNPCTDCCTVNECGCTGIPRTLHATCQVTVAGSPCIASVIPLTYNAVSDYWEGSGTLQCSTETGMPATCDASILLQIRFYCGSIMSGQFRIKFSCDSFVHFTDQQPDESGASCSPFNFPFMVLGFPALCTPCALNSCIITVTA